MESYSSCGYAGEIWLLKRNHLITLTLGGRPAGAGRDVLGVVGVVKLKFHGFYSVHSVLIYVISFRNETRKWNSLSAFPLLPLCRYDMSLRTLGPGGGGFFVSSLGQSRFTLIIRIVLYIHVHVKYNYILTT